MFRRLGVDRSLFAAVSVAAIVSGIVCFEVLESLWHAGARSSVEFVLTQVTLAALALLAAALSFGLRDEALLARKAFRSLSEHAIEGFVSVDASGILREVNPAAERMFGYRGDELIGRPAEVLIPERHRDAWRRALRLLGETGELPDLGKPYEASGLRRGGEEFPLELSVAVRRAGGGRLFLGVVRDVSDRKRTERELLESEARYRLLADHSSDVVARIGMDGTFRYLSPSVETVSDYTAEELVGESIYKFFHPDDVDRIAERHAANLIAGEPFRIEFRGRRKSGEHRWLEAVGKVLHDEQGVPVDSISTIRDVTDRKLAEQRLAESEARLRFVADHTTDLILRARMDGVLTYASPAIRAYGYEPEEVVGRSGYEFLDPEAAEPVVHEHARMLHGVGPFRAEFGVLRKDGSRVWVESAGQSVPDQKGGPVEMIAVVRDVTARREMETRLREREALYRLLAENSTDVVLRLSIHEGRFLYVSPAVAHVWQYRPEDLIGRSYSSFVHPDDRASMGESLRHLLAAPGPFRFEHRARRADGAYLWFESTGSVVRDAAGKPVEIVATVREVTLRKRFEERLVESERRLKEAQSVAALGSWEWIVGTDEVIWSDELYRIVGVDPATFVPRGESARRFVHPDDLGALPGLAEMGETEVEWEQRLVRPDGEVRWVSVRARRIDEEDGSIRVIGTAQDVTERRRAEEALRAKEIELRLTLEHLSDMVTVLEADGRRRYVSPSVARILGYTPQEYIRELDRDPDHIHPEDLPGVTAWYQELRAAPRRVLSHECRLRHKDGSWRVIENVGQNLLEEPAIRGLVFTSRDVTAERELEKQLREAQKLEAIGRLAAGVAHEVNNPLTWVLAGLDDLRNDVERLRPRLGAAEAGELRESLEEIRIGADRVRRIVRDLHTFGRTGDERRSPVDVCKVLRQAIHMTSNEIRFRAQLRLDLAEVPLVFANEGRLLQVFLNLLINASQAIPEGEPGRHEVAVETWTEGHEVAIAVRDTGVGIPEEHRGQVFEPFFTTKPPGEGSGLGLSISHSIVTSLDGRIEVESEDGGGTSFVVRLPIGNVLAPEAPPPPEASAPAPPKRGGRILLVDDEPLVRSVAGRALRLSYDVIEAGTGREALSILGRDQGFDAIVCDLMMPDLGGIELHDRLCSQAPELARRMIFMTGGAFTAAAHAFLEQTGNPTIAKPFEPPGLLETVARFVEGDPD